MLERLDRRQDQPRAVVDRHDPRAGRKAADQLRQARLDVVDHVEGVGAEALQGDSAGDLALAVEVGEAAPLVGPELDAGDVLEEHRRAGVRLHHDLAEVLHPAQVSASANDELEAGQLDGAAADVGVAAAHDVADAVERDAEVAHALRVDDDVVLLDEAADAGDLGDALRLGQPELEVPVLHRAGLGEVPVVAGDRVLVGPAHAGGVGSERRRDAGRQALAGRGEVFEDAASRPVDVGAVLEDHVDEGDAKEGEAAHDLRLRHRQHRGRQRIGDLVFDDLRRLAGIIGVDDDLRVGEVGDRVERQVPERVEAARHREQGRDDDEHGVPGRPGDDLRDHGFTSGVPALAAANPSSADFRLLSASMRKFAPVTTFSPGRRPCLISM